MEFPLALKKCPDASIWETQFPGVPPKTDTIKEVIMRSYEDPVVKSTTWRRGKIHKIRRTMIPLEKKQMSKLTFAEFANLFKKNPAALGDGISSINMLLRFLRDGEIKPLSQGKKSINPKSSTNSIAVGGSIQIRQAEVISEADALNLIMANRGKNAEFKNFLAEKLNALLPGQAYAFVPENLPEDPVEREKDLQALKATIGNLFTSTGMPFRKNYIPSKNLFVIMRKDEKIKPTKGVK